MSYILGVTVLVVLHLKSTFKSENGKEKPASLDVKSISNSEVGWDPCLWLALLTSDKRKTSRRLLKQGMTLLTPEALRLQDNFEQPKANVLSIPWCFHCHDNSIPCLCGPEPYHSRSLLPSQSWPSVRPKLWKLLLFRFGQPWAMRWPQKRRHVRMGTSVLWTWMCRCQWRSKLLLE